MNHWNNQMSGIMIIATVGLSLKQQRFTNMTMLGIGKPLARKYVEGYNREGRPFQKGWQVKGGSKNSSHS